MEENDTSAYPAQGIRGTNVGVDVMDVIMRGLETARRNLESRDNEGGGGGEAADLFCGFAYGSPGTFCPLFYWHADAASEAT